MSNDNLQQPLVTLDVDWASDWAIDTVAEILVRHRVKATWFVTHDSAAVRRLLAKPELFECGIHPNCLPGSTQGQTEQEVLSFLKRTVPGAVSMRTHSLYQSSRFLLLAAGKFGIAHDASLFLPHCSGLRTHRFKYGETELLRSAHFWEDDYELSQEQPLWNPNLPRFAIKGERILSFHPVHIVLNTVDLRVYEDLKRKRPIPDWNCELTEPYVHRGDGPRTMFEAVASMLAGQGRWIRDLEANEL